MNVAEHPLAEDVMAFLDSELSSQDAQVVYAHLEECAVCASLAATLRATSQQLSHWTVPAVSPEVERFVLSSVAILGPNTVPRNAKVRTSRRISPRAGWLMGTGAAAAVILVLLAIPSSQQPSMKAMSMNHLSSTVPPPAPAQMRMRNEKARQSNFSEKPAPMQMSAVSQLGNASVPFAPMIARTASLNLVVKDVDRSRSSLDTILVRYHGYAAQLSGGPHMLQASLRIPASDLAQSIQEFKTLGRVTSESQSGEDIANQHQDLVARLKTARETEERFQAILRQRTGSVADVLEVEEGIARVRGEIESMESEQNALEHRVNYATVDIGLFGEDQAQFNSPAGLISIRLHNSLVAGYRNARETLLGIVLFLEEYGPAISIWITILGLPIALLWRRYRRIHSKL